LAEEKAARQAAE
jgi:hypothetical protein